MKIAVLADVHANLPALEVVLAHAREAGAEAIWNAGDWVGYNAFPDEVVERLRQEGAVSIAGNYDRETLAYPQHGATWKPSRRPEKRLAFQWAYTQLSAESRCYLAALPHERRLQVAGRDVLLCHGSPAAIDEHLEPDTPDERLHELAELAATEIVICGHSHQPFVRWVAGTCFLNPGSVGRPDDGDPRTSYALLTLPEIAVESFRLPYDVERAAEAILQQHLPPAFAAMIRHGRKLKWVLRNLPHLTE